MSDDAAIATWLKRDEAAAYARRGARFLIREAKAGRLRAAKVGGRGEYLFKTTWIDEWLESLSRPVVTRYRAQA